jgi:cobalt-zinc-cadmium efflux system protein
MAVSSVIFVVELVAGIESNSLALMADAGHVFADVSGMAVSLGAIWLATRPATAAKSFGLYRLEILAAAANAVLLLVVSAFVLWEGWRRLSDPPGVQSGLVVTIAGLALLANVAVLALLSRGRAESLTIRGAYVEVLGDLLGAAAVLVAGLVTLLTGLRAADAIASLLIGVLILPRSWSLLRDSIDVLLEATPRGVNMSEVRRHILEAPGVDAVHDIHAWTITSGMNVVSAHVVMTPDANPGAILDHLGMCLSDDFDIDHSTFQLETAEHVAWEGRAAHVRH